MKGKNFFKRITATLVMLAVFFSAIPFSFAAGEETTKAEKIYKLWYDKPAPDESADGIVNPTYNEARTSGWENWQLPIGNGYMGAAIFGRTDRERVQLSDKTLHSTDKGLMNFAETYIFFNHDESAVSNYYRDLNIRDSLASVSYDYNGVTYKREYLTSYPDNVMAIRLTASGSGNLNFSLEPMIPFLASETSIEAGTRTTTNIRTGTVVANESTDDTITLSGHLTGFEIDYEAQYRIVPTGGTMTASNTVTNGTADKGKITVKGADSAIIYVALDTNYKLSSDTFTKPDSVKLSGNPHPHDAVSARIETAVGKGYDAIKADHITDVRKYFDRVTFDLGATDPGIPTDELLTNYKNGNENKYLDELVYHYGRYLLIASSRENSLPAHLTGAWNAYDYPICLAGYWHNINLQMNYWGVFSSNLTELFESYVKLYEAFLPDVSADASAYIKTAHPQNYDESGNNGWGASTRVTPYSAYATRPSGIDGAGTGAMAADLLWDYYEFTGDEAILKNIAYPAISGSANYMSRQMEELDSYPGLLLIPSAGSPENHVNEIPADGTAFAQGWAYSNYLDTLKGAKLIGVSDSDTVVGRINSQIDRIDPIQVGYSGQIKEFREETTYGQYGEWNHRHISHLIGAFPADFINSSTPAWQDAVNVSLKMRGDDSPSNWSWEFAHRMNVFARTNKGDKAYNMYQIYIKELTKPNLWANGSFQIDGNLGVVSGVDEMLLQSHEGYIAPLAAMAPSWTEGSYDGLVARGNFVVGATWKNAQATEFRITSRNGGECKVKYPNIANATLKDSDGNAVQFTVDGDVITFNTTKGKAYTITAIPNHEKVNAPESLEVEYTEGSNAKITWSAVDGAAKYNLYRATNSSPTYDLVAKDVTLTSYTMDDVSGDKQYTYAITALSSDGTESPRTVCTTVAAITPKFASGTYLDSKTLQIEIDKSSTASGYRIYADGEFVKESPYTVIVLDNADSSKTYTVKAVIDELVGAEVAVEAKDATVSKKALYDVIVSADAIDLSQYDESFAQSITNEKNKAVAILEGDVTEAEVAAAAKELGDVIGNLDMVIALGKIISSNTRIVPMDKTIAVFSHPTETSYRISSDALISALSIESGYTLSYVDENKEANATTHVVSGYIKVSKAGQDDCYIPIVKKGATIDNNLQDNTIDNGTTNASYSYVGGIGGKAENEMSSVFTVGTTSSKNMPRIIVGSTTASDSSALKKVPYTVKFQIYADGDTTAAVNYRWKDENDSYRLFRWYPDGTYKYNVNGTLVEGGTLERGKWHDIAIVYCSQKNRYELYVNNELQEGASVSVAGNYYCALLLGMQSESASGKIAFSNLDAYYGYYYPPFKPTPEHLLTTMTSSNSNVAILTDAIAVYSHPSNTSYQISSDTLISALKAETGWNLSYVNSSKNAASVSHVKSGFVKATHDEYADVYIPVTHKGAVIDNDFSNNAASYKGTTKATYTYSDGIATFTAGNSAIDGYTYAGIGNGAGNADAIATLPYTVKFKMKVTGNAVGVVNYRWDGDSFNIIRINGDGSYTHMNNANTQVSGGTLAKDEWHDITIVYDAPANRFQLWVNEECKISNIGTVPTNYFTKIVFAIASGSSDGTVQFKDFDTNYGYYYPPFNPTASYLLSTMISDNSNIVIGKDAVSVFSHPTNASYQISSAELLSAITIEDGWTLGFADVRKEDTTTNHVKNGYIKATHAEYGDVFIPVTCKGDVIDNDHSDNAVTHKGTTKATYAYSDGVMSLTAGATAMDAYSFTGIGAGAGQAGAIEKLPYTIGFKMKLTGDATGAVNWRWDGDGFNMLRLNSDGTYQYRSGASLADGGALAKNQWHDVVMVYDAPVNKFQIWVDGVCKATDANCPTNYHAKLVFAIATGSMNGAVSFKDFDTHYGYYYEETVVPSESEMTLSDVSYGTKTTFTLTLSNGGDGVIYVAAYSNDGSELVSVTRYDATEQRDIEVDTPNGETVKVMWWSSTSKITPVTKSEIISAQ